MSALETGAFERADFDSGWCNLYIFFLHGTNGLFWTWLMFPMASRKVTPDMIVDENTIDLFGVGTSRTDGKRRLQGLEGRFFLAVFLVACLGYLSRSMDHKVNILTVVGFPCDVRLRRCAGVYG